MTGKSNNDGRARARGLDDNARVPDTTGLSGRDVVSALHRHAQVMMPESLTPGLYLVATPIGNLSDITLRALHVLARADMIYCEDTRHSRTLMTHYSIATPLKPYHEYNAVRQRPAILKALSGGARVALISDAGTPLISDPGYKVVREAIDAGHTVISIPGASSALTAVTSAGLPTDTILFAGFLPPKQVARQKRIAALASVEATLVFFEAPHRVAEALDALHEALGDRPACLARELTKLHETVRHGTLSSLRTSIQENDVKGECVILVGYAQQAVASDDQILSRLENLLTKMSLKDAARRVADELSVAKSHVYDLGVTLKRQE